MGNIYTKKIRQLGFCVAMLVIGLLPVHAQVEISGQVTNALGEPLIGVNILELGTSNGTATDVDGNFSLVVDSEDAVIAFTYIGHLEQQYTIGEQRVFNIVMEEESEMLEEIVVTGYGTQRKSDLVSSVAVVEVEDATRIPTTNVAEMLRGRSPGIQVTLADARPGGNSNILIRGQSSLLGGNAPLFIIDGVNADNIDGINPDDIKSIEVLKDASAQAIYGARAANGVILITTKRGNAGGIKVNYHGYYGQQWLSKNFDLYSGEEWAQMRREAFRTDNPQDEYEPDDFVFTALQREIIESGEFVDWEDEVMRNPEQQNHSLSLSGGSEFTRFFASFGYFDQSGLVPGSAYQRGNARLNLDQKVSDRLSFGANLLLRTERQDFETEAYTRFITLQPVARVRDERGELLRFPTDEPNFTNPLWDLRESNRDEKTNRFYLTLFGDYEFLPKFKYRLNANIIRTNWSGGSYQTSLHSSAFGVDGRARLNNGTYQEYLIENIFTYETGISTKHNLDITFVQSVNERSENTSVTEATGFPNDLLGYNGIASASMILPVRRTAYERALLSFMGRVRLNLFDKYLLTATARTDGSSVFAPDNKWGFFPSFAVGWKLHREPILSDIELINELKLRASYGSVGNEAIQPYQTLGLASPENYLFGEETSGGYQPGTSLFNPDLKWETSTTFNVGLDFGLFKNVLVGSFEYYNTETTDLLVDRTTPGGTGYNTIISNIGRVRNRGIELGLEANIIRSKLLDWSVMGSFTRNRNTVLELFGEVDEDGNPLDDIARNRFIGHPINVMFQYEYDGIWQTQEEIEGSHMPDAEPGRIRVVDIDGDGAITGDDRTIIPEDPDWYGNLATRVSIGGFDLFVDFYAVQGATRSNFFLADFNSGGTLQGVLNGIKVDYWLPENPGGTFPRPRRSQADDFIWAGAVQDASYIRLRTVSLAYHMPRKLIDKIGLADLTIYATGTNLATWTDFLSYSPEVNVGSYPDAQSIIFGIKISN